MKKELKVGSLVQLLDPEHQPISGFLGLVLHIKDVPPACARVHWMQGGDNSVGHYWGPERLHVVSQ